MFPVHVLDAINDFTDRVNTYRRLDETGRLLYAANDVERGRTLHEVSLSRGVSLLGWSVHDTLLFSVRTYPEELLHACVDVREGSHFLAELYNLWHPTVLNWVCFLRRFCVLGSFRLFVAALRLNHFQKRSMAMLGRVLIYNLPEVTLRLLLPSSYPSLTPEEREMLPHQGVNGEPVPFGDDVLEAVAASFVYRPHDIACSRQQARDILELTGSLGPEAVGIMCRRLFLFLSRPPTCECDVVIDRRGRKQRRSAECMCPRDLQKDLRKEHARVLFSCILDSMESRWELVHKQSFMIEACAYRFSRRAYEELSECLLECDPEDIPQNPKARWYTQEEKKECYHTNHSVVVHAGCAGVRLSAMRLSYF